MINTTSNEGEIPVAYATAAQDDDDDATDNETPVVNVDATAIEMVEASSWVQEGEEAADGIMRHPQPNRRRIVVVRSPRIHRANHPCSSCIVFCPFLSTLCFLLAAMLDTTGTHSKTTSSSSAESKFPYQYSMLDYGYPDPRNNAMVYWRRDFVLFESACADKCSRASAYAFFNYKYHEGALAQYDSRVACLCYFHDAMDESVFFCPHDRLQDMELTKAVLRSRRPIGPIVSGTIQEDETCCF
eukprot:scaffold779_cov92-Cylindrotheca_fusiformis.AAC.1